MPLYDYSCVQCGKFDAIRPMAENHLSVACPHCGAVSARHMFAAPGLARVSANERLARSTNERASHEPQRSAGRHPNGCACCQPSTKRPTENGAQPSAKSFVDRRPWMISH